MLDVKDNWPENFIEAFPNFFKKFARLILFPYFKLTSYIFNNADAISSITTSFINWIKSFQNKQNKNFNESKYFVSPLVRKKIIFNPKSLKEAIDFWNKKGINVIEKKHFSFVGSLSNSFDFKFILKISNFLITKHPNYIFIICGTGDKYLELKQLFSNSPNVMLVGEIDKYKASILIKHSVASLAPYLNNQNFQNSIPNKVIESLENSVPFITNTEGELRKLIEVFDNGIFLEKDLKNIEKISNLIENKELLNNLKRNSFNSYQELFNFEKTYQKIIFNLKKI
jgi:glycosyltransferase involved in cell wall biosynthesis